MNKEQIIDEVYNKWIKYSWNNRIYPSQNDKDIFIDRIKTEPDFSIHWGLKIEEKELSLEERNNVYKKQWGPGVSELSHDRFNSLNIPTKLITITYNDKTIEIFH
jgi:hypothetical protein